MRDWTRTLLAGVIGGVVGAVTLKWLLGKDVLDGDSFLERLFQIFSTADDDELYSDWDDNGVDEQSDYVTLTKDSSEEETSSDTANNVEPEPEAEPSV